MIVIKKKREILFLIIFLLFLIAMVIGVYLIILGSEENIVDIGILLLLISFFGFLIALGIKERVI